MSHYFAESNRKKMRSELNYKRLIKRLKRNDTSNKENFKFYRSISRLTFYNTVKFLQYRDFDRHTVTVSYKSIRNT